MSGNEFIQRFMNTAALAQTLTTSDLVGAFHRVPETPEARFWSMSQFPADKVDIAKLFEFLAKLTCPPVCVGHVNSTGWHQVCEGRAQEAMRALGFTPPDITPIPDSEPDL